MNPIEAVARYHTCSLVSASMMDGARDSDGGRTLEYQLEYPWDWVLNCIVIEFKGLRVR